MVNKGELKKYASDLMFDMDDEDYDILEGEFDVFIKQMDVIATFNGIDEVSPMSYPFVLESACLREDVVEDVISNEELLSNCKCINSESVMLPKVVK
ncbi:MAG: Asp-tRNA(Asn)/Glu-tRNA(Gln) amidotransferase GatCAB subunit C [Bacilli bacterium]